MSKKSTEEIKANNSETNRCAQNAMRNAEIRNAAKKHWFILEPAVFFVFGAISLSGIVYQNLIIYQTCNVVFQYNETACRELLEANSETNKEQIKNIETEVQPYVARILMTRSLLESIIPAFASLFIGPWSDKFGRRPIILSTFTGYFFGFLILSVITFLSTKLIINPWLFLLSSLPAIFCGGTCALLGGIYCYITDVATTKERAFRMVLNEASMSAGMTVGNIASGYIYKATSMLTVFSISTMLTLSAVFYVQLFLVESIIVNDNVNVQLKIREFFSFDLLTDLFRTFFKRRPRFDRSIIWLTMASLTLSIFIMGGECNVMYLFLRKKFQWTLIDYTWFNATGILVQILGDIVGILILRKMLGNSIISITLLSIGCCIVESIFRAIATHSWHIYLGVTLGAFRGLLGPMGRAILSHVTPTGDVGKIFALLTSLESISPLGSAPLYTFVYSSTINFFPGAFNIMSCVMFLVCFFLIAVVYGIQKTFVNPDTYEAIGR